MTTKTFTPGQQVEHSRFGTGTVVSQTETMTTVDFGANGVKSMITRFTSFGKGGAEEGTPIATEAPKKDGLVALEGRRAKNSAAKQRRDQRDAESLRRSAAMPNAKKIESSLLGCNGIVQGNRNSQHWQMIQEELWAIDELAKTKGESFIVDVIASVSKHMRCSDKQAFVIARFADANGYKAA